MKNPLLTVDTVIIHKESVTLIKRKNPPYKGSWALPGGFVEYDETVESAAIRETKEETGLDVTLGDIVGVYSNPERDPRGHIISICFLGKKIGGKLVADTDAAEVKYFCLDEVSTIDLAFDHGKILEDAFDLLNIK
ncbi:NUDIX hydrolase [Methanobacterium spitsbergense]|uniref:NUDIX hydrolase n=1 Tax=Methanobacterium spitsbergense TaxID=2874285 RepID=A0A8T5UZF2_9EURY|nr:NUDIX hydrolase [Methanobacterium spitsbergense]